MASSGGPVQLDGIRSFARKEGVDIGFLGDISPLWVPLEAGGLTLPNRVAIQPLEAADADAEGAPTRHTLDRYLKYAEGCVGLIWFEACSVDFPQARTHESMLVIKEGNLEKFKRLVERVKERSQRSLAGAGFSGVAPFVLQLSHGGRFRKERSADSPIIANRIPEFDEAGGISEGVGRVISDEELEELRGAYVEASSLAFRAGFDAVDVKACHGYLLNELLASFTREGRYGGEALENRSRFLLETISDVIDKTDIAVTSRMSAYDGVSYPYGFGVSRDHSEGLPDFDASEPIKVIKEMQREGMKLVNISIGNPYFCPFVSRPFATIEMGGGVEHPIRGVERHFKVVEELKQAVPKMIFIGSGYSWLRNYSLNAAAHNIRNGSVDVAGWGRLAIANPGFPLEAYRKGTISPKKVCTSCSSCIKLLRFETRVGCVVHDEKARRRFQKIKREE
jgi:2,4-dienoyl-CoA reductase-like NADH-dependent reductase (Old Yellow Enzyme family)